MDRVLEWVAGYERAWRSGDLDAVARLFTEDASYKRSPYEAADVGHDAIRAFWADDAGADISVEVEPVAAEGDRAVVRLHVVYHQEPEDQEFQDLWVLRFADDGRVAEYEEWPFWPGKTYTPGGDVGLRIEVFPRDLHGCVDFYTRVLRFAVAVDRRPAEAYVAMRRGSLHVGAVEVSDPTEVSDQPEVRRRPPTGVELVLEVADVQAERDRIVAAGWSLDEDLVLRPWGLTDFRLFDPDGYYWRVTHR